MSTKHILITGATGKQGGSVIKALLSFPTAGNYTIHALTRNSKSASAQALLKKYPSITLVEGDLEDSAAVIKKLEHPVWGVFSVQTPMGGGQTTETEERYGKALIDAAIAGGVKVFVQTSVDRHGGDEPTNVPHFISKHNVEVYLKEKAPPAGVSYTILRPVFFMENFSGDFAGKLIASAWKQTLGENGKLQMISLNDIGYFAAKALDEPEDPFYKNQGIGLAGDDVSFAEANELYKAKLGHPLPTTFGFLAWGLLKAVADLGKMFQFFKDTGYGVDIAALRKQNPGLLTLSQWLDTQKKA